MPAVIMLLFSVELPLMAFSVLAAMAGQPALAMLAGTACVTLAGEIVRQALRDGPTPRSRRTRPIDSPAPRAPSDTDLPARPIRRRYG